MRKAMYFGYDVSALQNTASGGGTNKLTCAVATDQAISLGSYASN